MKSKPKVCTIANLITAIRGFMLIPLAYFLIINENIYALIIAITFSLLDIVDGLLAKRLGQETQFGKKLDLLTDFSFGAIVFFIRVFQGYVPWAIWVFPLIVYIINNSLVLLTFFRKQGFKMPKLKAMVAVVHNLYMYLLIINLYNTFTLAIFTALILSMYILLFDYFLEVRKEISKRQKKQKR